MTIDTAKPRQAKLPPPSLIQRLDQTKPAAIATAATEQPRPRIRGGEAISRTVFGGFWLIVGAICFYFSKVLFLQLEILKGLFIFGFAVASLAYAKYVFKGGRYRILFF